MNCPVCKNAMIVLELRDIEIDFCIACKGIWLDAGELEQLLDDTQKAKYLIDSFNPDPACTESKRKCPICDKKMEKVVVGLSKPELLIDKCPKGDGLWFDAGELNEITDRASLDEGNKIKQLLKDMFSQEMGKEL